jgi:hypothetical protein
MAPPGTLTGAMDLRDRLLLIGIVIAVPLILAAAGMSHSAGLLIGIALVVGGLAWTFLGSRE